MKIVAIIPSRYGSSRFEGKPLALIAGIPMIQHVYEASAKSERIDQVVVATDDERISKAVNAFGGQAVITSGSLRSGTDRVAEAAEMLGLAMEDIVINVQGDQPLMNPLCLDELVAPLLADGPLEMTTLAFRIIDPQEYTNPKDVKVVMDGEGNALFFSRSPIPFDRDADPAFQSYKHLGFYAYTHRFLERFRQLPTGQLENLEKLEQLRVLEHGYPIRVVITAHDSPEVDLPTDIQRIEAEIKLSKA